MLTILLVALAVTLAALFCVLVGASQQVDALNDQIDWRDARIEDLETELRHHQRGRHPAGRGQAEVPEDERLLAELLDNVFRLPTKRGGDPA